MAISEQLLRIERWRLRFLQEDVDTVDALLLELPAANRKRLK